MGSVTIQDGSISGTNLTRVVKDDNLSVERGSLLCRVVLGIRSNITTTNILDRNVPENIEILLQCLVLIIKNDDTLNVETDVITGRTLFELLVVHFDRLDFSCDVTGSKVDNHASLDHTGLNTTDWHSSNTADLVHILKRQTERLVGRPSGRFYGINSLQKSPSFDSTGLGFFDPALVPRHAEKIVS
jgi:hypothetical protein